MSALAGVAFPGPSPAESAGPSTMPSAAPDVGDRSQTFQPVEGGTEHRNGETLLVVAYGGLWAILMAWVLLQWTKQTALSRRLDALEKEVAHAARVDAAVKDNPPPRGAGGWSS